MVLAAAIGAAADLDVEAGDGGDEVGPLAQMIAEELAEAARLRDGSRHASAPGQLVTSASEPAPPRPSLTAASRRYSSGTSLGAHPAKEQVLVRRDPHRAVAVGEREVRDHAKLGAGEIAEGDGDGDERVAVLLLGPHVRRLPIEEAVAQHGRGVRDARGTMPGPRTSADAARLADSATGRRRRAATSRARSRPAGARRRRDKRGRRLRPGRSASAFSNSARHTANPSERIRNFIRFFCLCL